MTKPRMARTRICPGTPHPTLVNRVSGRRAMPQGTVCPHLAVVSLVSPDPVMFKKSWTENDLHAAGCRGRTRLAPRSVSRIGTVAHFPRPYSIQRCELGDHPQLWL